MRTHWSSGRNVVRWLCSIRGFATMLAIGLLANVSTAVFVSRAVFELALGAGRAERIALAGRRSARDAPASTATSPQ